MVHVRLVCIAFLAAFGAVSAQEKDYVLPVYVTSQCDSDTVGQRVAFKIKEGLRRSTSMTVTDIYLESTIQMSLVCMRPDGAANGTISHYSYSITFLNMKGHYDYQLTHGIGSCGTKRVDECAEGLVAGIDSEASALKRRIGDGSFKPFDD